MSDAGLMRLLVLARRELDASDTRVEIGGDDPDDPCTVWCTIAPMRRLVAVFDEPPEDYDDKTDRLRAIAEAFAETMDAASPNPSNADARRIAEAALDAELEGVAVRAGALAALIVDPSSPVVWGASKADIPRTIDALLDRDDPIARAAETARESHDKRHVEPGMYIRTLAGTYKLVLIFDGQFREPHTEGVVQRARSRLERRIAALPPVDPPPMLRLV